MSIFPGDILINFAPSFALFFRYSEHDRLTGKDLTFAFLA